MSLQPPPSRPLGRSGLEVSPLSFGAYAIGGWYWGDVDEADALEALTTSFRAGTRGVDTAPVYGFGHSERLIGRSLTDLGAEARSVVVMTKVGLRWDDPRGAFGFDAQDARGRRLKVYRNSRPDSLRTEVDRSLERLGVERIDLVQVHAPDPTTPIAETMGALDELREEGKLTAIGVSNYSLGQTREAEAALGATPLASIQSLFHLLDRSAARDLLPHAQERGIGALAYSPLDQGLLTGKVGPERKFPRSDGRHRRPSFTPENRRRVNGCLERFVAPVARRHGCTVAQVVLAWTAAQPGLSSVLVGARNGDQARENAVANSLCLTPEDGASIGDAFEELELAPPPPPGLLDRLRGRLHRLRYGRG